MKKLLLHVCCGPCGIYPLDELKAEYEISVFYYNPNIHPEDEYEKRLESVKKYCQKNNIDLIIPKYKPEDYFTKIKGQEKNKSARCPLCYELRLEETAKHASKNKFDCFTSTLLISPHQDIDFIKKLGEKLAKKYQLEFYSAEDKISKKKYKGFRPGFTYGRKKSKEECMYHQKYCGCIFSQNEL